MQIFVSESVSWGTQPYIVDAKSGPREQIQRQKFSTASHLASWQCGSLDWWVEHRWSLMGCSRTAVKTSPGDELGGDAGEGNALAAAIAHSFQRIGKSSNYKGNRIRILLVY